MEFRLPNGRIVNINTIWCWNEKCEREASEVYHMDGNDYPLCDRCAVVFDLGTVLGSDVYAVPVREYIEELPSRIEDPEDYPDFVCWWEED